MKDYLIRFYNENGKQTAYCYQKAANKIDAENNAIWKIYFARPDYTYYRTEVEVVE